MERQRLMPRGHWGWRNEAWSTLSQGWRVGNLVFVGGQVALDDKGEVIAPGDIEAQTRAVYMAIDAVLQEAGARMSDVVKINSYLVTDLEGEEFEDALAEDGARPSRVLPGRGTLRHGRGRAGARVSRPHDRGRVHRGDPGRADGAGARGLSSRSGGPDFASCQTFTRRDAGHLERPVDASNLADFSSRMHGWQRREAVEPCHRCIGSGRVAGSAAANGGRTRPAFHHAGNWQDRPRLQRGRNGARALVPATPAAPCSS